jgi:hypothetical protein
VAQRHARARLQRWPCHGRPGVARRVVAVDNEGEAVQVDVAASSPYFADGICVRHEGHGLVAAALSRRALASPLRATPRRRLPRPVRSRRRCCPGGRRWSRRPAGWTASRSLSRSAVSTYVRPDTADRIRATRCRVADAGAGCGGRHRQNAYLPRGGDPYETGDRGRGMAGPEQVRPGGPVVVDRPGRGGGGSVGYRARLWNRPPATSVAMVPVGCWA